MIAKQNRDALYHLADALSEDVVNMSERELLAEVAENFGEPRALANEFNAIIGATTRAFDAKTQDLRRGHVTRGQTTGRFGDWVAQIWQRHAASINSVFSPGSSRWAAASLLVLFMIAGAAALYWADRTREHSSEQFAQSQNPAEEALRGLAIVRLSWHRNHQEALAAFRSLQDSHPALFGSQRFLIREASRDDSHPDGEQFYLAVGPFATMVEASEFCDRFKSAGGQCRVAYLPH
jgi:hypothetical protein